MSSLSLTQPDASCYHVYGKEASMNGELIPLKEARERLGVSKAKMADLVRQDLFPLYRNVLDKREKLVDWQEVQDALKRPAQMPAKEDGTKKLAA